MNYIRLRDCNNIIYLKIIIIIAKYFLYLSTLEFHLYLSTSIYFQVTTAYGLCQDYLPPDGE